MRNNQQHQIAGPYHLVSEPATMTNDQRLQRLEQQVESLSRGQEKMLMQLTEMFQRIQVRKRTSSSSITSLIVLEKREFESRESLRAERKPLMTNISSEGANALKAVCVNEFVMKKTIAETKLDLKTFADVGANGMSGGVQRKELSIEVKLDLGWALPQLPRSYPTQKMLLNLARSGCTASSSFQPCTTSMTTQALVARLSRVSNKAIADRICEEPSLVLQPLFQSSLVRQLFLRRRLEWPTTMPPDPYNYMEFPPCQPRNQGKSRYVQLNYPKARDREVDEIIEMIVSEFLYVLANLSVVPIIRCLCGGPAEMVVSMLEQRLRDQLLLKSNLLSEAGCFVSSFQRPILCIFYTDFELSFGMQNDFQYHPLVHDMFGLKLNKLRLQGEKGGMKSFEWEGADPFWVINGWLEFSEVAMGIETQLNKYKKDVDDVNNRIGGTGWAELEETDLIGNIKQLMNAVNLLSKLTERKQVIDKHTNMVIVPLGQIKENRPRASVSQGLMTLHLGEWVVYVLIKSNYAKKIEVIAMVAAGALTASSRFVSGGQRLEMLFSLRISMKSWIESIAQDLISKAGGFSSSGKNIKYSIWLRCLSLALARSIQVFSHGPLFLCLASVLLSEIFSLRQFYIRVLEDLYGSSDLMRPSKVKEHLESVLFKEVGLIACLLCNQYVSEDEENKVMVENFIWNYCLDIYLGHLQVALLLHGRLDKVLAIVEKILDESGTEFNEKLQEFVKGELGKERQEEDLVKLMEEKERQKVETKAKKAEAAEATKRNAEVAIFLNSSELLGNKESFDVAYDNIYAFHFAQKSAEKIVENLKGVKCKRVARSIGSVSLYVPGGTTILLVIALMLSVPAQIAGCKTIVLATSLSQDDSLCKGVLYCAKRAGISHIIKATGAQAISAMAWGTESCPKVEKIFRPGNQ